MGRLLINRRIHQCVCFFIINLLKNARTFGMLLFLYLSIQLYALLLVYVCEKPSKPFPIVCRHQICIVKTSRAVKNKNGKDISSETNTPYIETKAKRENVHDVNMEVCRFVF